MLEEARGQSQSPFSTQRQQELCERLHTLQIRAYDAGEIVLQAVLNFHVHRVRDAEGRNAARLKVGGDDLVERLGLGAELRVVRHVRQARAAVDPKTARREMGH